jgi:hypothetical protein
MVFRWVVLAQAHSESTSQNPPRHTVTRKRWRTRRLTVFLSISLTVFALLLYTWVSSAPALFAPLLHSFEFKIYEREFGQNASRPRITRHRRNILKFRHPDDYEEPSGHPSWNLHGTEGSFTASLFYIIMEIGINHKPFYLDIDTGSSLTWVHCRLKPDLKSPKQVTCNPNLN